MNPLPGGTSLRGGAYRLLDALAFGGQSILYRAREVGLNTQVAVKELYPRGLGRARIRDFLSEGRLLARFDNPGIVKVYDLFEEHGTAYLVMELLEGKTLRQCALEKGGRLSGEQVLAYARARCSIACTNTDCSTATSSRTTSWWWESGWCCWTSARPAPT